MNRTIKEAAIRSFHYTTLGELSVHLNGYLWAYSSIVRPLSALEGKNALTGCPREIL
ncbi:hypothetical protein [Vreelandella glaciei]|uniref:hypothetical protein n=1 Tax=Vreelandella glaciei TaxID=186761 RepID=UPI0030EF1A80